MKKPKAPATASVWDAILREVMDHYANSGKRWDLATTIKTAQERGISVTWDDLRNNWELRRNGATIMPSFVTTFLTTYATKQQPTTILDPWAGLGSLLIPIVAATKAKTATGITPSSMELAVATAMTGDAPISWVQAQPDQWPALESVDLIVSSPPIGLTAKSLTIKDGSVSVSVRDSGTYTLMLDSARHLSKDGVGLFLLPNGFFFNEGKALVRDALPKLGLHVNAVIALPVGTFAPVTSLPLNIVIISRKETPELFVCQLTPSTDQAALLKNLLSRKQGASLELGRLVPPETFTSFGALQSAEEEERMAKRSGLTRIPLNDVVSAVNLGKQTDDGGFANLPNCVYLPTIGTSPAVTALADMRIKPHNYVQLVVRPEIAHAEFLAGFFNSPLGRKTRDSMLSGTFIPKLSKQSLSAGQTYVLPLDIQQTAMVAAREIQDLRLRLEQLERDLWSRPIEAGTIRKAVSALNQKEGFESWLESLPFPLSSILWRYQAAGSAEKKVEHLFHAFEAVAQFLGTLMTSAFHSNPAFFREHRSEWFEQGKDNPHSLSRSSFGQWVVRCQRLAKTTRQMLSDKEQRPLVLDLYRADAEKVDGLANKGVYAVLDTVSQYRNNWKGHAGIVSAKEHERHLALLQEELTRLRGSLGGVFEDWWLIRPGTNTFTAGVFHYSAEKVMGSRQIFKQESITTTEVMDTNELYCYDSLTRRPLQLLHFVRMLPAPETEENACYFFNRIDKQGIRWVSYHFEKEAERVEPDAAVIKAITDAEDQ